MLSKGEGDKKWSNEIDITERRIGTAGSRTNGDKGSKSPGRRRATPIGGPIRGGCILCG